MARPGSQSPKVRLEDVMFYLDGVDKDGIEANGASRRSGEILALRSQMLKMPDDAFEATMRTVRHLISEQKPEHRDQRDAARQRQRSAGHELFEQTRPSTSGGARGATSKVAPT